MAKKISANLSSDQSIVVSRFQIDPANFTLSSLPDTSITSPVNGNFLSYYNNNWVNVDAPTARTNLGLGSLATLNSLAFADLTDKPTTIAGYGITDALLVDGDFTTAGLMQTNGSGTYSIDASTYLTSVAFVDLTSTPTTIAGYGITDAFDGATSSLTGDIDLTSQVTGILPVANMAATALTTVQTAATEVAQLALTAEEGDVVVRSDELKTYMHNGGSAGTMADFTLLATPTDSVTSVDGNTGAVTTLQLGTSLTTALAGNTVIPDVSDFITASSTEILTNKSIDATQLSGTIDNAILPVAATNITSVGSLTGLQVGSFSNGPTVMFAMGGTGSEGDAGYVAKGNFSVISAANLNLTGENLSFGSNNTMSFGGRAMFQYPVNITADFSQDNTNLFLYNTNTSAINSGSSIVFGAKYDSTNASTFLSEGPYIASYKVNATDNDYSFGLKFATIKNGATSQAVAMTIDEDQNVGINGGLTIDSLGTLDVPIPTVVTFDNQFGTTTLDVKSSASQVAANQKATITVSGSSRAAVEFRSRNFGNANYDLFFGHIRNPYDEINDYALLRAPTSRFVIKSDDDEVELNGTTVLLNTPTVEFKGSGYSSDLTSSIKPDNTNSSSSWKLTDKVLSIGSTSSLPTAMWLGDSGTKLYVIGSSNDDIDRFELTTPYDISSISATTSNDDGNGSVTQGMYFKSDGSRYWTVDGGPDYIRQYSLSTAWDIQTSSRSTNTLNGKAYVNIRDNGDANPTGVAFSADGLKVIICGSSGAGSTGDSIYSYTLGTPFDIFTMVGMDTNNVAPSPDVRVQFSSFTDLRDEISLPHDIFFLPDGLTLYVVCRERDDIVTFTLGTAFDITTMTYNGHLAIDDIDGSVGAVYVDPVNNIGLMIGQETDNVYQWTVDSNALIVDAQSTQFKGQLGVYDDLTVDGDVKISGKSFYKGALISSSTTTTFGNTILGNTTGVYTRIGHTSGVGTLDFGRSIQSQTLNLHGGVTVDEATKTLNIGTGGASGSTTNITIGTATAGATQTTTVNGALTVNSDLLKVVSTDDGATENPILSLYRNSSGIEVTDELGAIEFSGNGADGAEHIYARIYSEISVIGEVGANEEQANLRFAVSRSGGMEDPTMVLRQYGLEMMPGNNLYLQGSNHLEYKGQSIVGDASSPYDTELNITNPTADRTILLPDDSGTLSLDGENQTSYRTGEIIEVITGYADGSTVSGQATSAGVARDFALEDVTALQSLTTSYGKINGTLVNYLPPVGTKTLEIEYGIFVGYESPDTGIMHHKLNVGGTYVTNTRMTHRDDSALNKYVILKSILTVDGSGDVAAGNVDSWSSAITLQLDAREYGGSADIRLHKTTYYDGTTTSANQVIVPPSVKITAIG